MAKIVYRQMPAARELPQQIPTPGAKARMQKPQGGGKFLVQILRGERGMVMDKIDTFIILLQKTGSLLLLYTYQESRWVRTGMDMYFTAAFVL